MFTEQPAAPPQPPAQIAPAEVKAQPTTPPAPSVANVAPPEVMPASAAPPVEPPKASAAPVAPAPTAAPDAVPPSQPIPVLKPAATPLPKLTPKVEATTASKAAIAQRQAEVEAILLNLTRKSHAAQKEKAELQAATEAAKYTEAGEFAKARQAVNQQALAEAIRKSLLLNIQQQELAKTGQTTAPVAGGSTVAAPVRVGAPSAVGRIASPESFGNARYSTAPLMPFNTAELRDRLSRLVGRGLLNYIYPLTVLAPVTSNFGWRIHPISGGNRFHRGIDLGAPYGSPVVSAKAGVIEAAGEMDGYGLTVVIRHKDGQQTLYAHLSGIYVKPGDAVPQGQLIGLVGSTGNSTGPHLHFELHELTAEGWVALDPAVVLDAAIAFAKNPLPLASGKPQAFNLAASGLLDLSLPSPALVSPVGSVPLLSGLINPSPATAAEMLIPFTVLPTALPEIGWMVTPVVDTLLADELLADEFARSPLADEAAPLPPVSFSPVEALAAPMATSPSDSVAFKPMDVAITTPATLEFASTPLAKLIASVTQPGSFPLDVKLLETVQGIRKPQAPTARAVTFPQFPPPQVSDRRLAKPQPNLSTQRN